MILSPTLYPSYLSYSSHLPLAVHRKGERASARTGLLAVVSFLLGVAATAAWFHQAAKHEASNPTPEPIVQPSPPQSTEPPPGANPTPAPLVEQPVPVSADAVEALKTALPNYASLSLDDGTELLRQAALKEFTAAAHEMQSQVGKAEDELSDAENSKSSADQQAAMKQLQQVQSDEQAKLQQIAGKLQTQIAALKQLKSAQP